MSSDVSELNQLAADLAEAGVLAGPRALGVVTRGSLNVKNEARKLAPSGPYTPRYPASITYDVTVERDRIVGEIGPDKDLPQGALGNLLEYGTARDAPHSHLGPALDREGPNFVEQVERLGGEIL